MKKVYAIFGIALYIGFAHRLFNIETITDLGILVGWATAIILNFISFKHEKE